MRNEIPILKFSSHTPKYDDVGLYLNASNFHGGTGTTAVWMHGILVLESADFPVEKEQDWLESLNLVAISESNQFPTIVKIMGDRIPVQYHSKEKKLDSGKEVRLLPFSFNLRDILRDGLYDDNYYIHISAQQYCSASFRIVKDEENLSTFLEEDESKDPQFKEIDILIKAYDSYSAVKLQEAISYFDEALKSEEIRRHIDRPNLHNAGYCASQYALEVEEENAELLLNKTTNWMQEDLKIRNLLLNRIQKSLLSEDDTSQISRLKRKRLQLLKDLGF